MTEQPDLRARASSFLGAMGRGETLMLLGLATSAGLVGLFLWLADEVTEGSTGQIDNAILLAMREKGDSSDLLGPPFVEEMMRDLTALGSFAVLGLIVLLAVIYLLMAGKRASALLTTVSVLGGVLISTLLKMGYDRPRPDLSGTARVFTASFPSGHAMLSAVTFLTLGVLLAQTQGSHRLRVFFVGSAVVLTVIVGLSRLYLGVHYPSDVLAGWVVGAAWALLCLVVATWLQRRGRIDRG